MAVPCRAEVRFVFVFKRPSQSCSLRRFRSRSLWPRVKKHSRMAVNMCISQHKARRTCVLEHLKMLRDGIFHVSGG